MEVKLFTCSCGSNIFFNTVPHQFLDKDINNWNTFGLKAHAGTAAVLICLECTKIHIPPADFSGKSRLDPNVAAYGDLLKCIERHNTILEQPKGCVCPSVEVGTPTFNHPREEEEYILSKLDKQTMPTKVEKPSDSGDKLPKSQEPKNKDKAKTVTKVKKIKKPTKQSMQEKTVDGPN